MGRHLTPIKAIRAKCLDCSGNQVKEVRNCSVKDCSLHPYRMGRRPKRSLSNSRARDEPQIEG